VNERTIDGPVPMEHLAFGHLDVDLLVLVDAGGFQIHKSFVRSNTGQPTKCRGRLRAHARQRLRHRTRDFTDANSQSDSICPSTTLSLSCSWTWTFPAFSSINRLSSRTPSNPANDVDVHVHVSVNEHGFHGRFDSQSAPLTLIIFDSMETMRSSSSIPFKWSLAENSFNVAPTSRIAPHSMADPRAIPR
jgi:hypothetical protein